MGLLRGSLAAAAGFIIIAGTTLPVSAGEGAIKYRQSVMKAVGGHMGAMATILKGEGGNKADLKGHAHALAELAKIAQNIFPEDSSQIDGVTRAKDDIWDKPGEFKAVLKAFETESAKLAKVAQGADAAAFGDQFSALGKKACGTCHKNFREKKK